MKTFKEFVHSPERLYGQITVNGKSKIGEFRPKWSRYTNQLEYAYYTPKGNKGTGGFTMDKAYKLFQEGRLTTNPEHGNPANYTKRKPFNTNQYW